MPPGAGVKPKCSENRVKLTLSARQKDAKPGAVSGKALALHRPSMGLGQSPDQPQTEPQSADGRRFGMRDADIAVENARQMLGRDANAIVFNSELDHPGPVRGGGRSDRHA